MLATLEAWGHQIVEFVHLHEAWAAPIVFALAFGESLAFISLLIPAWGALVGIGYLIGGRVITQAVARWSASRRLART